MSLKQKIQELLEVAKGSLELSQKMLEKTIKEFQETPLSEGRWRRSLDLIIDFQIWNFSVSIAQERVNDLETVLAVLEGEQK